jgi:ribosomal protein S18 acetylase RimI-like enzyme
MQLTRRTAEQSDVAFLMRLRRESMDQHLEASGMSMSEAEHLVRLRYRFECAEVLLQDGNSVGLLKVSRDGNDWKIIQVQLLTELQGKGLGEKLLQQVIDEAGAAVASLTLDVLKANPARSLYERLGFVVEGESDCEYTMRCAL